MFHFLLTNLDNISTPAYAASFIIFLTVLYYWFKKRSILPGPTGVPYLGLYPYLTDENAGLKLEEYKKEYGDVFSFTYTGRLYINLGSIKVMREIILNKSDCFVEKYKDTNILTEILRNGVTFVNGEQWRVLRKFFLSKFKEYGLNTVRGNMAGPVYDSLNSTLEDLKKLNGKPVNIVEFLGQRSAITLRKMLFAEKGATDEDIGKMCVLYTEGLEGHFGVNMLLIGPVARLLFATKSSFRKSLDTFQELKSLVLECARKLEHSMNEEDPTCVIEEFFKERNKRRRLNDPTWKFFSDAALSDSVLQFVGDGIQAVAALIAGLFNALLDYPEEQEKLYSEIMEVIGPNRQPSIEDRPNLPYVNAYMNEYLRHTNFINFFPSLECTKETTIRGHRIPSGSILLFNFRSAHHDPDIFEDPDKFHPSRYMPSSGKPKAESPVTFGIGKRSCTGEPYVMLQAFLFLTTIVKNFKIESSNDTPNSTFELVIAGKLEITFVPRNEK